MVVIFPALAALLGMGFNEFDGNCRIDISIVWIDLYVVQSSNVVVQERFVASISKGYSSLLGDRTGLVFDDDDCICVDTIF